MAMTLPWRFVVARWAVLTALSVASAGAMAIVASPALASDTSGLALEASASARVNGAALTVTYTAPAKSQGLLTRATLALPIGWNSGVVPAVSTGSGLGTMMITPAAGTPIIGQITVTDQNDSFSDHPKLVVTFPSFASGGRTFPGFVITGALDVINPGIAFTGFPNVPFTSIVVSFPPGPTSPASIRCEKTPRTVTSTVTGQDGARDRLSAPLVVSGCPPSVSGGRLTGAASGKPVLSFSVAGTDGAALTRFTAELPVGFSFARHTVTYGVTTTATEGVTISDGKAFSVRGIGRELTVQLAAPTPEVTVEIQSSGLTISKALRTKIEQHSRTSLSGRVAAGSIHLALSKVS